MQGLNLQFRDIEYRNFSVVVLNLRAPSVLLGFQLGGIVGHRFLSPYRVALDLERSEVRLTRLAGGRARPRTDGRGCSDRGRRAQSRLPRVTRASARALARQPLGAPRVRRVRAAAVVVGLEQQRRHRLRPARPRRWRRR